MFNMKFKVFSILFFLGLLTTGIITMNSCKKDQTFPSPTVSLSATTYSGKIGQVATVTVTVTAPGGLKALKITKYKGTDVDATFGTNGTETYTDLTHTLTYTLSAEGLTNPIRFNFSAEDNKSQLGSGDFIITTTPSVAYLLTTYDWQWKSKLGKCAASDPETEQIFDCEKDNFYSFKADGTYTLNFGALTGSGGGTCAYDGLVATTTWSLNSDETQLTLKGVNVFDATDIRTDVYKIQTATTLAINSKETIDLSAFGCVVYDWTFVWSVKPK
jgi:hypothetical protein